MTWTVRLLDEQSYALFRHWYTDGELSRRISISDTWFPYVTQTPGIAAWMVFHGSEPVAVAAFESVPHPSLFLALNPALRGQGYCKTVLRLILAQPVVRQFKVVYGHVEPDNSASLRCAASVGVVSETPDADGLLEVRFTPVT